ncbi:hypothetical protein EIL50_05295 [bacterium NHP-B]|nr:hypothetical protein EIL50_05295 [bacterium NHP-B]
MSDPKKKVTFIQTPGGNLHETPGLLLTHGVTKTQEESVKISYFHGATGDEAFTLQSLYYGSFTDPCLDEKIKNICHDRQKKGKFAAGSHADHTLIKFFIPLPSLEGVDVEWQDFFGSQGFDDLIEKLPKANFVENEAPVEESQAQDFTAQTTGKSTLSHHRQRFSHGGKKKKGGSKKKSRPKKKSSQRGVSPVPAPSSHPFGSPDRHESPRGENPVPSSTETPKPGPTDVSPSVSLTEQEPHIPTTPAMANRVDPMKMPPQSGTDKVVKKEADPVQPETPQRQTSHASLEMSGGESRNIKWRDVFKLINPLIQSMKPAPKVAIKGSHYQFSYEGMERITLTKPHGGKKEVNPRGVKVLYQWFLRILQRQDIDLATKDESKTGTSS